MRIRRSLLCALLSCAALLPAQAANGTQPTRPTRPVPCNLIEYALGTQVFRTYTHDDLLYPTNGSLQFRSLDGRLHVLAAPYLATYGVPCPDASKTGR